MTSTFGWLYIIFAAFAVPNIACSHRNCSATDSSFPTTPCQYPVVHLLNANANKADIQPYDLLGVWGRSPTLIELRTRTKMSRGAKTWLESGMQCEGNCEPMAWQQRFSSWKFIDLHSTLNFERSPSFASSTTRYRHYCLHRAVEGRQFQRNDVSQLFSGLYRFCNCAFKVRSRSPCTDPWQGEGKCHEQRDDG